MGNIITKVFWPKIQIPSLDQEGLNAYSLAWQQVLAHKNVRLLKPKVVGGTDVLIVEHPISVPASSAYGVVVFVSWSKFNPDFTDESRTMFTKGTDEEIIAEIKAFQARVQPVIAELITPTYFPALVGIKYGFNAWPERKDISTFIAAKN